jgi:hypothetical protein
LTSNEATFVFWHSLHRAPARSSADERSVRTEAADPECYRLDSGATPARFRSDLALYVGRKPTASTRRANGVSSEPRTFEVLSWISAPAPNKSF